MANYKKDFLDTVTQQISCKPFRSILEKELEDHIEDRMDDYMAEGLSFNQAEEQAVKAMGDPVAIGTQLNTIHQVQRTPALTVSALLLLTLGFGFSLYFQWTPEQSANGFLYYLPGLMVLVGVVWKGYPFTVRYAHLLLPLCGVCLAIHILLSILCRFSILQVGAIMWRMNYFAVLLLCPVLILLTWHLQRKGSNPLLLTLMLCGIGVLCFTTSGFTLGADGSPASLIFAASTIITLLAMIHRDCFSFPGMDSSQCRPYRKRLYLLVLACLPLIGCLFIASPYQRTMFREFTNPDAHIRSTWDDTYNSALIRQLLSRTPLTKGLSLTPEEMMDYGTGAWYFARKNPLQVGVYAICSTEEEEKEFDETIQKIRDAGGHPRYIHYNASNVTLWDILPQHAHNNYLIALTSLMFGRIAGAVLVAAITGFYLLLFSCIQKIQGKLAFALSFSCGLCLLFQTILYTLGNLGFQYGPFTILPLLSEGRMSILLNMTFLGLILSAYRYDRIPLEPTGLKRPKKEAV